MERIVLIYTLVCIALGFRQGVAAEKPTITLAPSWSKIEDGVYLIQEGDELRIECQGEGTIEFSTQKFASHVTPSEGTGSFIEATGTYTFIRPNTTRQDTGWYACAEKGIRIKNDEQTIEHPSEEISWIYVYVNSSEPFAVMQAYFEATLITAGNDGVVPCRPTSPNLPVKLEIQGGEDPVPEDTTYDPKIGFILKAVGKEHNGEMYTCRLEGTYTENASWPLYYALVEDAAVLESPTIIRDTIHHVVWGQNLTLECRITLQGVKFGLNWTVPRSIPEHRIHYPKKINYVGEVGGKETWKAEVTIKDVQETDGGKYTCIAKGGHDNQEESSTIVQIWDPSYTYINISVDGEKELVSSEDQTVQWRVTIDTYPEILWVKWYTEDGTSIVSSEGGLKFRRFSHTYNGTDHFFVISHTDIRDSGNYTVEVITSAGQKTIVLPLTVIGQPIVHMDSNLPFYAPGVSVDFVCRILASPEPNITWSYIEYPNFPSKQNSTTISLSNRHKDWKEKLALHSASRVNVTINMTGDIICKSCNDLGCTENTQQIFVTDVPGFFAIRDPGMVTEGDNISLTCGASVYNYTDSVEWQFNKDSEEPEFIPKRMNITKQQTKFTFQSILHIRDVSQSDSGQYTCEALNNEKQPERGSYQLRVGVARAPEFTYTNMNNSEVHMDLKKDKKIGVTLRCQADGRPIPKITWYKNKELIKENEQYKFLENRTTLRVAYFIDIDSGRYACKAENRIGSTEKYVDIKIAGNSDNTIIWISLICVLIVIIIIVITYMGIKVHRERALRKELLDAGLTHFEEGALECLNPDLTLDDQAELLPYDKKWEFPRELLKLGKQLGSGAFGVVMKAEARGIITEGEVTTVAVKMVRRSAEPSYMKALSSELKIMIHLGRHLNVVNLLGACTKTILTKRELYVIVEYCRYGNLHNYLQRHRASFINQIDPSTGKIDANIGIERLVRSESIESQNRVKYVALSFSRSISVKSSDSNSGSELVDYRQGGDFGDINMSPDGAVLSNNSVQPGWRSNYRGDYKDQNLKPILTQDLLCWAWQVSRGMEYLSARNVLHGDLAARNILLADDNVVKICDFGLAKNMYKDNNYKKKGDGPLPIKWMAVESIRDRIFSTQSDVWSFGIVLWEFFTLARTPYPGMEAEKQYDRLIEGYRMEKPEYATDEIYELMLHCWKAKPALRPSFPELAEKIGTLLNENIKMHYLDLNAPYTEMNTVAKQNGQSDYLSMMSAPNHDYHNLPDPMLEPRPDSAYLSMSPLSKISEPGIFSPRTELEESHFSFPPPSKNTPINSDTEDCAESSAMFTIEDPYMKPIDVQQRRAEFVKEKKKHVPTERDSGYCNVTSNPNLSDLNNRSSDVIKDSDRNLNATNLLKNNKKSIPPVISGLDNYINMPQQKTDRLRDTVDSFTNPSYVIMSKSEDDRQFV